MAQSPACANAWALADNLAPQVSRLAGTATERKTHGLTVECAAGIATMADPTP